MYLIIYNMFINYNIEYVKQYLDFCNLNIINIKTENISYKNETCFFIDSSK